MQHSKNFKGYWTDLSSFVAKYANDADWNELSTDTPKGTSTKRKDKWNVLLSTQLNDVVQCVIKTSCSSATDHDCQSEEGSITACQTKT